MDARTDTAGTPAAGQQPQDASAAEPADRMPDSVRRIVLLAMLALLASAGLIVAVRGPAILIDLAATASRWLCL